MLNSNNKRIILIILAGLLSASAIFAARNYLNRGVWFDEALTIMEFSVYPNSVFGVYKNYEIPNNHIVYSIILRFWLRYVASFFFFSNPILRLLSLLAGIAFIILSFLLWRKFISVFALFIVLLSFALSPVFVIYATAIRGYIFSLLFISLAIWALLSSCENRKGSYTLLWIFSVLSVGTMPNNTVALFAASFIPLLIEKASLDKNFILKYFSVPFSSLLIFYLPIMPQFMSVVSIKEGWTPGFAAFSAFYISSFIIFFIPITLSIFYFFSEKIKRKKIIYLVIIFLLPALFFVTRAPSPFPRTFICFYPVWIFVFSLFINELENKITGINPAKFASLFCFVCFICAFTQIIQSSFAPQLSKKIFSSQQDDFFFPYYMEKNFSPDEIVSKLIKLTDKKNGIIYADMGADHQSLIFSAKRFGMKDDFIIIDRPKQKITKFPADENDKKAFITASSEDRAQQICESFGLNLIEEIKTDSVRQKIFVAERK